MWVKVTGHPNPNFLVLAHNGAVRWTGREILVNLLHFLLGQALSLRRSDSCVSEPAGGNKRGMLEPRRGAVCRRMPHHDAGCLLSRPIELPRVDLLGASPSRLGPIPIESRRSLLCTSQRRCLDGHRWARTECNLFRDSDR